MKKTGPKKILPKSHTGKIRHHRHTSYLSLALILILTVMPLVVASRSIASAADFATPDPGSSDHQTFAVVAAPIPSEPPTILNITAGTVFTSNDPLIVSGSCPGETLVKVFKNEVLAGATLCENGSYQVSIDLFVGSNTLIARAYNANDVVGPDSTPITAQLNLPGFITRGSDQLNSQGAPAGQFYITSEVFHRGVEAGSKISWPLTIAGGQAPYALSISWGDGKTELISRGDASRLDIAHTYEKPGGYRGGYDIVIKATDQQGNKSYLQLVAIVSGDEAPAGLIESVQGGYSRSAVIRTAWQVLAAALLVVLGFWLGEKREARILRRPRYGV